MMEYRTFYAHTAHLLKRLKLCEADGTYLKELGKLLKAELLILDDFGLQGFDGHTRETLMDIVDDRYNRPERGILKKGSFKERITFNFYIIAVSFKVARFDRNRWHHHSK